MATMGVRNVKMPITKKINICQIILKLLTGSKVGSLYPKKVSTFKTSVPSSLNSSFSIKLTSFSSSWSSILSAEDKTSEA
jgi:hypothetical protein